MACASLSKRCTMRSGIAPDGTRKVTVERGSQAKVTDGLSAVESSLHRTEHEVIHERFLARTARLVEHVLEGHGLPVVSSETL